MPKNNNIKEIDLLTVENNSVLLPANEGFSLYLITGDVNYSEATEHLIINPIGDTVKGMQYNFAIPGNIPVGTFGIQIFERVLTSEEAAASNQVTCIYNGTSWDVYIF